MCFRFFKFWLDLCDIYCFFFLRFRRDFECFSIVSPIAGPLPPPGASLQYIKVKQMHLLHLMPTHA